MIPKKTQKLHCYRNNQYINMKQDKECRERNKKSEFKLIYIEKFKNLITSN